MIILAARILRMPVVLRCIFSTSLMLRPMSSLLPMASNLAYAHIFMVAKVYPLKHKRLVTPSGSYGEVKAMISMPL